MSVINQVLSDLEKRGAPAQIDDFVVRAVPAQHGRRVLWLTIGGALLGLAVATFWWDKNKIRSVPPAPQPMPIRIVAAQPLPVQPVVPTSDTPATMPEESTESAMRLSFELSSIPLPSTLRKQSQPVENSGRATKKSAPKSAKTAKTKSPAMEKSPAKENTAIKPGQQIKHFSAQQLQENEFRRATSLVQQGRSNEAYAIYESMLKSDAGYDAARQTMVAILLDSKRNTDAENLLQQGLQHNIKHSAFAMLLARLQVERGALPDAVETLRKTLPYADRQADYQAFVAALLQRQNNHAEAIEHYQIAVQLTPKSGVWLMGLGISLHAVKRNDEARDVFKRAMETGTLSAELQEFVEKRLKEL